MTLVLADAYPLLLEGLEQAFKSEPGFRVLACCADGDQAVAAVLRHHPNVLVLDLRITGKDAMTVLRELALQNISTRVVLLAEALGPDEILEATRLGVRGFLLKSMARHLLMQCVRKVHRGQTWLEKVSTSRAVDQLLRHEAGFREVAGLLTHRELDILRMAVAGCPNKEIASKLTISEGTVKVHLHHIYEKLGVKGRLELALYARDKNLFFAASPDRSRT
jgi:DNA-binding NarL/FixJ family response regulator